MNVTSLQSFAARGLIVLPAASLLLAAGAYAQSSGCDEFKDKLASRVDPSITAFTLEIVKSSAPVPPGAKVFGTCDGGAYKILFRRGGSTRPAPAASAASAPAAPQAVAKPIASPPPAPAPRPAPASAPSPAAQPVVRSNPPASAAMAATPAPVKPASAATTSSPAVARSPLPVAAPPAEAPKAEASLAKAGPEAGPEGPGFLARHMGWIGALLLLPLIGGLWAWRAHRSAYDEAGLPRGPRL